MARVGNPISRALTIGRAINGLRGWGWVWAVLFGGGGSTAMIALLRQWWDTLPALAQVTALVAIFAASLLAVGYVRTWWRQRQRRLEDVLDVRIGSVNMVRQEVEGGDFWLIYVQPTEITYKPPDPAHVATLDFLLSVSLFASVSGRTTLRVRETDFEGLFKAGDHGIRLLRAPLRLQGPSTERGCLLFVLPPMTVEAVGGWENIDHNNSTLEITDHITGRTTTVMASRLDWSQFGGPPPMGGTVNILRPADSPANWTAPTGEETPPPKIP